MVKFLLVLVTRVRAQILKQNKQNEYIRCRQLMKSYERTYIPNIGSTELHDANQFLIIYCRQSDKIQRERSRQSRRTFRN